MEETMSKRDWAMKDLRMVKTAILKSWIEGNGSLPEEATLKEAVEMIYKINPADENHLPKA